MMLFGRPVTRSRPFLISGPCVIESEALCLRVAEHLRRLSDELGLQIIFKASFDKANRTSGSSFRGLGMEQGLEVLAKVRAETGLPVLTDVHSAEQVARVAEVADVLQTPAFLARQTDLIAAVGASGRPANIKKAQFMAPEDMGAVIGKANQAASDAGLAGQFFVCERGSSFGYRDLIVDMRSLVVLRETGCPIVFDATHSVQQPGALGDRSGGRREYVEPLARAAVAIGVEGLFMETHPNPDQALSDGPNAVPLGQMGDLLKRLLAIASCSHEQAGHDRP
ncbi:3-deoxy-8-phosphooctulonate synthase [Sphingomonas sp. KRR8]|uniref:3-deoxy-8-phosphooctulonate synthase n=1 Tax=Sphingomonas sp. KRR8 TaxID=2942996 RepID=UPI00201FBF95|nr:3-deoxy-8-phosphooctulonate synthase [Sphingomonas sp. KRR8]URD60549.1 3-deoxy-8-phosphooctulonate synthase [Sphingomonas sp. KRR8]